MPSTPAQEPADGAVLVTGVGREIGIGHAVARRLTDDGFTVATAGWRPYDDRMPWGADPEPSITSWSGLHVDADLIDPGEAAGLVHRVHESLGRITGLVLCHAESVDSSILTTTVASFDRHMAVNARATWLLVQAFAEQLGETGGSGRIVAITSDHTAGNLPYGASKGAMDRIVLAAAVELADLGVTANVINPGATDTGWMTEEIEASVAAKNLQPRVGRPEDVARLVSFLCSAEGQWINGQTIYSDGGLGR